MSIINHRVLLEDHPSYLKWFGTGAVTLIYAKKLSVSSNSEDRNLNSDIDPETSVEECDLTGQPLYVDLGDNSNNAIETLTHQSHDRIWPKDELRHYPLPVREARKTLNKILREGNVGASQPYYVLCAGDDSSKTVLLGANISDFMGCSVQLLKPLPACKVESSLEDMVLAHLRNCFTDNSQIKYLVKMSYNVYGGNIDNTTDQKASKILTDGNISVDITAQKNIFRPRKNGVVDVKMNVSVVVGHPLLKLSFIWPQLLKLQRIFSILSDSSNFGNNEGKVYEKMSLCDVPLDTDDILQSITNLVSIKEFCPIRKKDVVDVNNLRHLNILDRLWDILSCCENVSELNYSFSFLFSELLEIRSNICLVDVSDNIGILIKRILEGHRVMPKNSVKQSLEFLFELGARKLKLDFQTIISQFPGFDKTHMDSIWKSISTTPPLRSTTFNKTIVKMQEQLAYLCQLYVASELFYLVKDQVNMSEDGYKPFCKSIEQEYIFDKSKITDFKEIISTPLHAVHFNLDINYASFIDSMLPSQWTLTMESGRETTIYHLSPQPIYPPEIISHVPPPDIDGPFFYVTKMNRSYTKLC
ncbi:uncharacterized protein LOC109540725 isoform X1 [Dendroctonus ponderosae]|uniref:Protein zwilch n=1 Tax=Dendroctonus ponderosae TaxID=77166 RepID=A0AAR5PUQ8_DENPD|nr:uncharacterized protein LOC109540725 isoform X1 [Dendroctonus ponderosae]XP_048521012.1 uncharacterized protein LOC109540725 isoform X1 [Dendroctonus ponderosae]